MSQSRWSVQDAKNSFSAVVEAAMHGQPQTVTKHGRPAVVVLSVAEYERLQERLKAGSGSFVDHLLAMPGDGETFERLSAAPRDVDF